MTWKTHTHTHIMHQGFPETNNVHYLQRRKKKAFIRQHALQSNKSILTAGGSKGTVLQRNVSGSGTNILFTVALD